MSEENKIAEAESALLYALAHIRSEKELVLRIIEDFSSLMAEHCLYLSIDDKEYIKKVQELQSVCFREM